MQWLVFATAIAGDMIQQSLADANLVFDSDGYNRGRYGPDPYRYYYSTDVASPLLLVNQWDRTKTDNASYIFLTLDSPVQGSSAGSVIYRADDLSLVYSESRCIILVSGETGEINWTLGGKNNDFVDLSAGNATDFAWQRHARLSKPTQTQLTLFDNHGNSSRIGCTAKCSRGKHLEIDYESRTVRLISEFYHPEGLAGGFEGSYQPLRSGNVFLGWGANPTFTEHTSSGECVLDVQFDAWRPDKGYPINYRAFEVDWKAYPTWNPQIAALEDWKNTTVSRSMSAETGPPRLQNGN
ncbi:putative arylsulfotransferase-like protein [Rosellinia necatrix]|uniref:Putative arylsulfotransferase-like protein n=1 Tax=Rosellinia necatrix TaxID=77044 RepID=A0A1W2TR96_ROSNE|nr:putative arylsulfotransferase-like protein [Rosellinia necatrix]